ncbi:MAG: flagellar motor protein MotB [Alphaproteobacteria bacterium]|nr:flagellar motor protein MotB [Alphaproteobacteria bacterium]
MSNDNKPIIIKKVKKGGHGHHGGAWKVAYADFVTAMMAFFLLLWLLNATTEEQKRGIANYFDPVSASKSSQSGSGGMLGGASITSPTGSMSSQMSQMNVTAIDGLRPNSEGEEAQEDGKTNIKEDVKINDKASDKKIEATEDAIEKAHEKIEEERFKKAETELRQAIQDSPDLKELSDNLLIEQTPEGMRIQIIDKTKKEMFPLGSAEMFDYTQKLLEQVGQVMMKLPNQIEITGHTDATPYKNKNNSNWELSSKRANASRRVLDNAGIEAKRIEVVSGKADKDLLVPDEPESPMNRRISLTLLKDSIVKQKKTSSTAVKNTEIPPKNEKSNAKMMIPF